MRSPRTPRSADILEKKLSVTKTIDKRKERDKFDGDQVRRRLSDGVDGGGVIDLEAGSGGGGGNVRRVVRRKTVKHPTGNKMRDKVRAAFAGALTVDGDGVVVDKDDAMVVACDIEDAMWVKFKMVTDANYKAKFRTLHFNLKDKKNRNLREAVVDEHIKAERLIEMTSEELANDDLKKYREEVKQHMMYEAQPEKAMRQVTTDMWRCGKCKQRKCTYYQLQTRSADEPMTTFITCTVCNNRWTQSG